MPQNQKIVQLGNSNANSNSLNTLEHHSSIKSRPVGTIEYFVRFLYYLCFIPYRPEVSLDNKIILKRFLPQQIICALVYGCALLNQGKCFAVALQNDVLSQPLRVVSLAFAVGDTMYILCWVHSFWRKPDQLAKLISETSNPKLTSQQSRGILHFQNLILSILPWVLYLYDKALSPEKPVKGMGGSFECQLLSKPTSFLDNTLFGGMGALLVELLGFPRQFMFDCGEVLILILTICSYNATSLLVSDAENVVNDNMQNGEYVGKGKSKRDIDTRLLLYTDISKKLKQFFAAFNNFSSGFYFTWFCMIVPWLSFRPIQTLQMENFPYTFIYHWSVMIVYGFIWGHCAEIKRKAQMFIDIVKEDVYNHQSNHTEDTLMVMTALKQIKHSVCGCGVKAGRFFQFSYESFGSVIGLVIAYALLFIQFHTSAV